MTTPKLCEWCGEAAATKDADGALLYCDACREATVECLSCGDRTQSTETIICVECEAERQEAREEDDGSPRFSRLLAGLGGRVMQ